MCEALNLITLGFGYVVYTYAAKEKKNIKFLGQAIGCVIMIGSVISILLFSMTCANLKGCPFSGKKGYCPMMAAPLNVK